MPNYPENSRQQPMFTRHPFGEPKWQLQSQSEFDGLAPSQIVRYLNAGDRGFEDSEVQGRLAARLDATPDADNYVTNPAAEGEAKGVTVDAHRYVVDPIVDNDHHQYVGLYTGGPVRTTNEPSREGGFHKRCTQVLTRTFCAGHGYWVDEAGRYHAAWPDGNGGWTGRNPDVRQVVFKRPSEAASEDSDAPPEGAVIREYMTADDALKAHRPWLDSKLSPYMALHPEAFPSTFVREVYWREFTHESIAALEELGSDRARLEAVVAYHFTEKVAPQVLDAHCRLDPQTNTVVFVCSLMYVDLGEPQTPDDLLDLPCLVAPCTRETLRMFGWNQLRDGEGYKYTHVFRWPRLKDTPEVRRAIEFVKDNKAVAATDNHPAAASWILALLAKHDPPAAGSTEPPGYAGYETIKPAPVLDDGPHADNTGRLTAPLSVPRNATVGYEPGTPASGTPGTEEYTPAVPGTPASTTSPAQFYRIAQQQVQVEQDGSLSFSIALVRTEWHGADSGTNWEDGGTRQLADLSSAEGWGRTEHRVIPSVPRENAIPTMLGIKGSTYRLVVSKRQTEGSDGHSDVSFQQFPLYNYTDGAHTPENIQNPFDIDFDAVSQSYNPYPRPSYSVTYERVAPGSVGPLIQKIKSLMGGDPAISVVYHPEGYYTVTARGTGKTPRHIEEWLVAADWFKHETVEQWLGVTLETNDGERGFYEYPEGEGEPIPESDPPALNRKWHSIKSVRGDLDANWMGSLATTGDTIDYTTGHGTDAHTPLDPQPSHGDDHTVIDYEDITGNPIRGWSFVDKDPDELGGNGAAGINGDGPDKLRSHVLTRVHVSTNEDGTYNLNIHRTYPHQRVWVWRERQAKKKGDWRYVYRAHYRNWPSRHAIYRDLVLNLTLWIANEFGESIDLNGNDWTWHYSPSVNEFGLVDDGGVTIAPVIWGSREGNNDSIDEGLTNLSRYKIHPIHALQQGQGTKISPDSAAKFNPGFKPLLGHYFNIQKWPVIEGVYRTQKRAQTVFDKVVGGNPTAEGTVSPYASGGAWKFKVVLAPVYGPTEFVYNGPYPGPTALQLEGSDIRDYGQDDFLPKDPADPEGEREDADDVVDKFNGHLQQAMPDGVISRATWELWFSGGAGNNGTTPAGGGGGAGNNGGGGSSGS